MKSIAPPPKPVSEAFPLEEHSSFFYPPSFIILPSPFSIP